MGNGAGHGEYLQKPVILLDTMLDRLAMALRNHVKKYEKYPKSFDLGYFWVREAGLEPARPEWALEPESSESANSTTRAFVQRML